MLQSLAKAVLGVALLPVDAAADVFTLGGVLSDAKRPYTAARAQAIMENLRKATDGNDDNA